MAIHLPRADCASHCRDILPGPRPREVRGLWTSCPSTPVTTPPLRCSRHRATQPKENQICGCKLERSATLHETTQQRGGGRERVNYPLTGFFHNCDSASLAPCGLVSESKRHGVSRTTLPKAVSFIGCGGLQCTEAARPAVSIQVASQASYPPDSTAS